MMTNIVYMSVDDMALIGTLTEYYMSVTALRANILPLYNIL